MTERISRRRFLRYAGLAGLTLLSDGAAGGAYFVSLAGRAGLAFRMDSLQAHFLHQALHSLVIDRVLTPEIGHHPWPAIERRFQVLLIDRAHQMQVERALAR